MLIKACPNCGSDALRPFLTCKHKGQAIDYASCGYCGLIFQNPTATEAEWAEFYRESYRTIYNQQTKPTLQEEALQLARAKVYLEFIRPQSTRPVSSHLDVGCSMGILLQACQSFFGVVRSNGVDPGQAYRDYCKEHGLACWESVAMLPADLRYDLITLCHVLEHVNQPVNFLRNLVSCHLADDGLIFIEVPNVRGGFAMEIAHPFCFSQKTLQDTCALAGLEILRIYLHGRPKSESPTDHRYIAVIARRSRAGKIAHAVAPASYMFKATAKLALWHGMTHESWPLFMLKYPVRVLKYGFSPKVQH